MQHSLKLLNIAKKCNVRVYKRARYPFNIVSPPFQGLSGRSLRKLPVMALAKFPDTKKYFLQDLLEAFDRSIDDIRALK